MEFLNKNNNHCWFYCNELLNMPYKKYIYGNDTVYIWFIYVFMNSISKFRIFNKDLIFCNFIKTRCVRNLYGIFKPYMQIIRFTYVIYKPYVYTNVLYT